MTALPFEHSYAQLPEGFFREVEPARVPDPALIRVNEALAADLGLDPTWLRSPEGVAMLSGNRLPEGAKPIALAYAGHQFGGFSPRLGDGRAILIGELIGQDGVRRDVQLKGSGRTPWSRGGDGKSPLGPVIREYVVSEAMTALGIPATRALAAVTTGEVVYRQRPEPGGVFTRVAQSHVRIGTFQYFHAREEPEHVQRLADYVIDRHYPEARAAENPYRALLEGVVARQATLIAQWMQVGFVHGVMNTDNTQIAGETIDFGPCAFMEEFHVGTVFSSIDRQGRYAWGNQPSIAQWNLTRLAETLLPLLAEDSDEAAGVAAGALGTFAVVFNGRFLNGFRAKLGLAPVDPEQEAAAQDVLAEMFDVLTNEQVDFTLFFRHLTRVAGGAEADDLLALFKNRAAGEAWLASWRANGLRTPDVVATMRAVNPIFIPRNHRVEEAIQASERGDYAPFERLLAVLARPFDEQPEHADLERPATPDEAVTQTFCGT